MRKRAIRILFRIVHLIFYKFVYGRRMPFAAGLEGIVRSWERQRRKGDTPASAENWDTDYSRGRWAYMKDRGELARYSIIVGYIAHLKPQGAVLDVGCGEGVLFKRYRPYGYSKYLGLDISEAALAKLLGQQDENTTFVRADAETYKPKPTDLYDAVIFNEVLYYFSEPLTVMQRYLDALKENGVLIVSTYTASYRAMAILRQIRARYPLFDEIQITHGPRSWVCTVFAPPGRPRPTAETAPRKADRDLLFSESAAPGEARSLPDLLPRLVGPEPAAKLGVLGAGPGSTVTKRPPWRSRQANSSRVQSLESVT